MKNTLMRNMLRSAVFLLLLALMLSLLSVVFRPKNNNHDAGMYYIMAHGFLAERERSIDVLILGDSESYSSYSPLEMWDAGGFTSYVSAIGGETLDVSYSYLLEATAHQQPRLVIIEGLTAVRTFSLNHAIYEQSALCFPIMITHDNWKSLTPKRILAPIVYTHREANKGFKPSTKTQAYDGPDYMTPTDEVLSLSLLNRIYLMRILHYCDSRNIPVLLVATPSPVNWNYAKHSILQQFAEQNGVPFLDLNLSLDELGLDHQTDWQDGGDHLNLYGATKLSRYMAAYLAEQYDLPDHRKDSDYENWSNALNKYRETYPDLSPS